MRDGATIESPPRKALAKFDVNAFSKTTCLKKRTTTKRTRTK
jgi:hypothetical protein